MKKMKGGKSIGKKKKVSSESEGDSVFSRMEVQDTQKKMSGMYSELSVIKDNAEMLLDTKSERRTIQNVDELTRSKAVRKKFSPLTAKFSPVSEVISAKDIFSLSETQEDGAVFINLESIKTGALGIALEDKKEYTLNFLGSEQINDCVLDMFVTGNDSYRSVKVIDLTGCLHVTDAGIVALAKAFPHITTLRLNGCLKLTSRSLQHLSKNCIFLKTLEMRATDISLVTSVSNNINVDLRGCPLISPMTKPKNNAEIVPSLEPLKAYKICLVKDDDYQDSLVGFLTKGNPSQPHLMYLPLDLTSNSVYHLTEVNSTLLPLFMADRCVFIFSFKFTANIKRTSLQIASKIMDISSKVHAPQFLLVGCETNQVTSSTNEVVTCIKELIKGYVDVLSKERSAALKDCKFMNFHDQQFMGSIGSNTVNKLADLTERIELIDINLANKDKITNLQSKLEECIQRLDKSFPEYEQIPSKLVQALAKLFELVGSSIFTQNQAVEILRKSKMFPKSEYTTAQIYKILDMAHVTGVLVKVSSLSDQTYVTTPSCVLQLYQALQTIDNTSVETVNFLPKSDQIFSIESAFQAFSTVIPKSQVRGAMEMFVELGVLHYIQPDVFVLHSHLQEAPHIALDNLWEDKVSKIDQEVTMMFNVSYMLSNALFQQLMTYILALSKHRQLLWKQGLLIQDGFVDVLLQRTEHDNGTSQLVLTCRTFTTDNFLKDKAGDALKSKVCEMLWMVVNKYSLIVDYALHKHAVFSLGQMKIKTMEKEPAGMMGYVPGHRMKMDKAVTKCMNCGIEYTQQHSLWTMSQVFRPTFTNGNEKDATFGRHVTGNICKIQSESETVSFQNNLSRYDNGNSSITILSGDIQSATLNIQSALTHLELDFSSGTIKLNSKSAGEITDANKPAIGDTIIITLNSSKNIPSTTSVSMLDNENDNKSKIILYKNAEVIFTEVIADESRLWKFYFTNVNDELMYQVKVNNNGTMNPSSEIVAGMRLEAKDRMNPSLVCVATIQEVSQSGLLLIHFDGWTDRYDYWAHPTSDDLHPVGYMEFVGHTHSGYKRTLQSPQNYNKPFTWRSYLQEINALPVPNFCFTEEQQEGTPPDEEYACLDALSNDVKNYSCPRLQTTSDYIEKQVQDFFISLHDPDSKTANFYSFWQSQNSVNKFFMLFPESFDVTKMQHPSRHFVSDLNNQTCNLLCSGLDYEVLHFVNVPGSKVDERLLDWHQIIPTLRYVVLALFYQEAFLPNQAENFCKGLETFDRKLAEKDIRKWLAMYAMMFEILSPWKRYSVTSVDVLKTQQAIDNLIIDKSPSQNAVVRCEGHEKAISTAKELTEIPMQQFSKISHLLYKLDVQNNHIKQIPDAIAMTLTELCHLDVSSNALLKLPDVVCELKHLTWLDVSTNQIIVLPQAFSKLAHKLTHLNISSNPFVKWPVDVLKCVNLVNFHARNVGSISTLLGIGQMKNLKHLDLSQNLLCAIPDEMSSLEHLTDLLLSGIRWMTPFDGVKSNFHAEEFHKFVENHNVLSQMTSAERIKLFTSCDTANIGYLNSSQIDHFNRKLYDMYPRFGSKHEAAKTTQCFEGGFPKFIVFLTKLEKLDLSFHALKCIPREIEQLTNLKSLRLWYNIDLETVAAEVGSINLSEMHLKGCTALKTPPKEIIDRGFRTVHGYLKRLQMGSVACRRTKLMLVGLGGAGKTSLIRALMHKNYHSAKDLYQDEFYEMKTENITDGIDINTWVVPVEGNDLEFGVWDFAGQTVYYNTHQFFLSRRAVYLLLWNIRLGYEHAGLDFWLSSIACHAPGTPIIIVGTHCDKVEKSKMPHEELKKRYPQIKSFHTVSSYTLKGIPELQSKLIETTLAEKYMGEHIPQAWLTMESKVKCRLSYLTKLLCNVKTRNKGAGSEVMPWSEVETMGGECGILDPIELTQTVQFLHDLGSVQFFNTEFLKSYVVIQSQWIVDVMACVVSVHESHIKEGRFAHADMKNIWKDYPTHLHSWLLRLTEEFDLTFPLTDMKTNLVPCLLPDIEPKFNWPDVYKEKDKRQTEMVYSFQYLPAGLFNRVQVRLHQFSDSSVIWKRGSLLKKNKHLALLKQTTDTELEVRVQGARPENMLFMVHEVIEHLINESFHGVLYDLSIPCMDCADSHILDPCMFSASKVHRAVELKAPFLQCDRFFHTLSIPELQASMPPDRYADFDLHLGRNMRDLQNLRDTLSVSVFISYCDQNVPNAGEELTRVHPRHIITDLEKADMVVRHTRNASDDKLADLALTLKTSDVIVVCISSEYVTDQKCCDFIYFAVNTLRKSVLLIQLGDDKNWLKSKVYINMQNIKSYDSSMKELIKKIRDYCKNSASKTKEMPTCFISYAWSNSLTARNTSNLRSVDGALGWGDPRELKDFLEKNGVPCWMDVEQVGQCGLYEDIAEGLRHAKVMVACVSDEYAASRNCQMEYRYALMTLKIPTILTIVGTGYAWLKSEIGMLSVGNECPQINFQYENASAHLELLKSVQSHIPADNIENTVKEVDRKTEQQTAFQEVLELAQRKFLRQVISYADATESAPHPRLIVLDLWRNTETNEQTDNAPTEQKRGEVRTKTNETDNITGVQKSSQTDTTKSYLGFTLLCEHEQGWHDVYPSIPIPPMKRKDAGQFLSSTAAYTARILSVLRHSGLNLNMLMLPEADSVRNMIDEMCVKTDPEFGEAYRVIVSKALSLESNLAKGRLKRCQLANGRVSWLCDKHTRSQIDALPDISPVTNDCTTKDTAPNARDSTISQHLFKDAEISTSAAATMSSSDFTHTTVKSEPSLRPLPRPLKRQNTMSQACSVM